MTVAFADHRGNGAVKRGRGRPRKPCAPPEAFTPQMFLEAMAEADKLDEQMTDSAFYSQWSRRGMHRSAFRLIRKLQKKGPAEARRFHEAYLQYIAESGLLE